MFYKLYILLRELRIKLNVLLLKIISWNNKINVGNNVKCFGVPSITITGNASITIGNSVIIKKAVELRAHNNAQIIIGDGCKIDDGVRIIATNGATVNIGANSKIGFHSVLNGGGGIEIGKKTSLYGFVYIQSSSHLIKGNKPIKDLGFSHGKVKIGSNVLLGANTVILPSIEIANDCVIGANAVVTRSVDTNSIMMGVPAKYHSKINQVKN